MSLYKAERNQKLANHFINKNSDMSFAGVLVGNNEGIVWVDDLESPTFALIWSKYLECFQFMENGYQKLNGESLYDFIRRIIIPFLKECNIDFFEFACDSEQQRSFIRSALSYFKIKSDNQWVYKLDKTAFLNIKLSIPKEYIVYEIDSEFMNLCKERFKNFDILENEIKKSWGAVNNFLAQGKGLIATYENIICSFALTHFRYDNTYAIGIETFEPHKQKGLSSYLSKQLIQQICLENSTVWWDCMESNIASQKTAERAGLIFDHKYECCWFNF